MAENLTTSVRREIDRLQKEINRRSSELASLKELGGWLQRLVSQN